MIIDTAASFAVLHVDPDAKLFQANAAMLFAFFFGTCVLPGVAIASDSRIRLSKCFSDRKAAESRPTTTMIVGTAQAPMPSVPVRSTPAKPDSA